jgi:hypothetical protein
MATPVTVSRIQNRRGTQAQFDALYPAGYEGTGGYGSLPGFTVGAFPNVLRVGEIGLCTDSRNVFIGNLNAEYISLGSYAFTELKFLPLTFDLPPSATFTLLPSPGIDYALSPFFRLLYSVTDVPGSNWNAIGISFSRNAELAITAVAAPLSIVDSVDTGTEINDTPYDFSLRAVYSATGIAIEYLHTFPGNLRLNTTSISWAPSADPLPPPPPLPYPTFDSIADTFDSIVYTFDEGP